MTSMYRIGFRLTLHRFGIHLGRHDMLPKKTGCPDTDNDHQTHDSDDDVECEKSVLLSVLRISFAPLNHPLSLHPEPQYGQHSPRSFP
jgi:hypothetical protein